MGEAYCSKCGAPVRPGAKFCGRCGSSLSAQPPGSIQELQTKPSPAGIAQKDQEPKSASPAVGRIPSGLRPSFNWGQRIWDIITMGGCTGIAGLWYWYSGMAETAPDYKTCAATVLLPLSFIVFRRQIDRLLMPLQGIRNRIPPLVRLGMGLAMPFLVSNHLYARGFTEFEFMFKAVVISTLASFVILRNPIAPSHPTLQGGPH